VDEFFNYLKVSRNFSENTLISYKNDLNQLEKFLSDSLGENVLKNKEVQISVPDDKDKLSVDIKEIDLYFLKSYVS
jgi:site-specific recombinase XerD